MWKISLIVLLYLLYHYICTCFLGCSKLFETVQQIDLGVRRFYINYTFFYCKLLIFKKKYNLKNWKTKESQSTCIKSRKFVSFILKIKKDVFGWFFPHSELFLFVHYNKCACWVGGWGSVLIKILITV